MFLGGRTLNGTGFCFQFQSQDQCLKGILVFGGRGGGGGGAGGGFQMRQG